ncbi:hypothetical protein [Gluconobacter oxydans]|uniref:Uncharacterized protein n=1 Tax=Gluconobacter oxydans NBRC 3293 TaxID=1315969 RepID=A0A829XDL2_GLUOY|nr:hypothetical protein [Gluconobacter oxydans]GEM18416.1 hypothetical protein NBRC3293_2913 [Gluconobacter oxydans NBRC 3293]GEM18642.1 hypothetical protein NBRC3293_3139 [Gluconobacter oxydans NBRC 3293]
MNDGHSNDTLPTASEMPVQMPLGDLMLEIFAIQPPRSLERSMAERKELRVLAVLVAIYVAGGLCLSYRAWIPQPGLDAILIVVALVTVWALVSGIKNCVRAWKTRQTFFREMAQDVAETIPQSYQMVLRLKPYPREELLVARREYDRAATGVVDRVSALKMSDLPQAALLVLGYLAAQIMGWMQTIHAPVWRNGAFAAVAGIGLVYFFTFLLDLNLKLTRHRFLRIVDLLDEAIAAQKRDEELVKDAAKKSA